MATITYNSTLTVFKGSAGIDELVFNTTAADLRSASLIDIEVLKAGLTSATTFTVDQADLLSGGSVQGSTSGDHLVAHETRLDLTSTTLTSIEVLDAGSGKATTFTLDQADLSGLSAINGSTAVGDSLVAKASLVALQSVGLSGLETLKAGLSTDTLFRLDAADLASLGSAGKVIGSSGKDTLASVDDTLDLSSIALTSIEVLKSENAGGTLFKLDQADLAPKGSILGSSGKDTIAAAGAALDLTSTALSSIEFLAVGKSSLASTFTITQDQLNALTGFTGGTGSDTLVLKGTDFDLTAVDIDSLDKLKAGTTGATTFSLVNGQMSKAQSSIAEIIGGNAVDTLTVAGTDFFIGSTVLTSVERLLADSTATSGVRFTLDQAALAKGGEIIGTTRAGDQLAAVGTSLDLTSTTLTNIELVKSGAAGGTAFIVGDKQLLAPSSGFAGNVGSDTLIVKGTLIDLTGVTLSSIETIKAGLAAPTTFRIPATALAPSGGVTAIAGSTGSDTLIVGGTDFDLRSVALTSIERLVTESSQGTTFSLQQDDLAAKGSIVGHTAGSDTILAAGTSLDLSSTTLTSIDHLAAGNAGGVTFTVTAAQLNGLSVLGSTGADTLRMAGTLLDLTSTSLGSIERLAAGTPVATTFKLDLADLASGGSVVGSSGVDTLVITGNNIDLTKTSIASIEKLATDGSAGSNPTNFILDGDDLVGLQSISAGSASKLDTLEVRGSLIDLTSTTLTGIDIIKAGLTGATTFLVDAADLISGGTIAGTGKPDTLKIIGTAFDLTSTSLSSVEALVSASTSAVTFTVDQSDLLAGGSVVGGTAAGDTLVVKDLTFDLSATKIDGIEVLKAKQAGTTFLLDQDDVNDLGAAKGSIVGTTGTDKLQLLETFNDLSSVTLNSVEIIALKAGGSMTRIDARDLVAGGSILGSGAGIDELVANGTLLNLSSTTLSSIEKLSAGGAGGTTFILGKGFDGITAVTGSAGADKLVIAGTSSVDISGITFSGLESVRIGAAASAVMTVTKAQLVSGGGPLNSLSGNSGSDTLVVAGTDFDLTGVTLTSIEKLQAQTGADTRFSLQNDDLAPGGTIAGGSGTDTILAKASTLDLSSTTLTSIEALRAGNSLGVAFTMTAAQLGALRPQGSTGDDTLAIRGTLLDLTSITLSSIENFSAAGTTATTFRLDAADIAASGNIEGNAGVDTLTIVGTNFDFSNHLILSIERLVADSANGTNGTLFNVGGSTLDGVAFVGNSKALDTLETDNLTLDLRSATLSSVEILQAFGAQQGEVYLDQADLASGGSILGNSHFSIYAAGSGLDLTSTTLDKIETLSTLSDKGTSFVLDLADLKAIQKIDGDIGIDTLVLKSTDFDLTTVTLSHIDALKAGLASDTVFKLQLSQLQDVSSIIGSTGTDSLVLKDSNVDLRDVTLTSVEKLGVTGVGAARFTLDQADLAKGGSITGANGGTDAVVAAGTLLDLSSTTLTSIERLETVANAGTQFILTEAQLAALQIFGSSGDDTLSIRTTNLDVSTISLDSIETLKAGSAGGTVFTVSANQLGSGEILAVIGSSGIDTLTVRGPILDLDGVTLTSIERLQASPLNGTNATEFAVTQDQLASKGSIVGNDKAIDTIALEGNALDLTSTTLTSIERLITLSNGTNSITVNQGQFSTLKFDGSNGSTTLKVTSSDINLAKASGGLVGIDVLAAGLNAATTFTVKDTDLRANGGVVSDFIGGGGIDTLSVVGSNIDLTQTQLTSIEKLAVSGASTVAASFIVNPEDLAAGGSVIGSTASPADSLGTAGTRLDLTSTTLTSIEILKAIGGAVTEIVVDQADLATGGSVIGSGNDKLFAAGTSLDLSATTLTGIKSLWTQNAKGTTFTIDEADRAALTDIVGSAGADTLIVKSANIDLTAGLFGGIESLKAGLSSDTLFTLELVSLSGHGGALTSIFGGSGIDTLTVTDTAVDLGQVTLTSIEKLAASGNNSVEFLLDQADLAKGGSVIGSNDGEDAIVSSGSLLDLSSSTLTGIELLKTAVTGGTQFTVTEQQLVDLTISGSNKDGTLIAKTTAFDVSNTTLADIATLKAGVTAGTTFTVDPSQIGGTKINAIVGTTAIDTLIARGTLADLDGVTLTGIERLQADTSNPNAGTTFALQQDDLASKGSIIGNAGGTDTIQVGTSLDLSGTTLVSIERVETEAISASTITVNQSQFGSLTFDGSFGAQPTAILVTSTDINFTKATGSFIAIETLGAGLSTATTFTVEDDDLAASGGDLEGFAGGAGVDTLSVIGTSIDLSQTKLTSIEKLAVGGTPTSGAIFTVNQDDLAAGGSVIGSTANATDQIATSESQLDLSSTTLTSIEQISMLLNGPNLLILDQTDLAPGGVINGRFQIDTLATRGPSLDLTSTSLFNIDVLKALSSAATTFTVDPLDLVSGGTVQGGASNADVLIIKNASFDLTSTTLSGIEVLKAGAAATVFNLDKDDLISLGTAGSIIGSADTDTLLVNASIVDLGGVSLSNIEFLEAVKSSTTFRLDQNDLAINGLVQGSTDGGDKIVSIGSALDLSSTALSDIEELAAGYATSGTTFTVGAGQLNVLRVTGSAGADSLVVKAGEIDVRGLTFNNIENLKAGLAANTTFHVEAGQFGGGGLASIVGSSGQDTLIVDGTDFDLGQVTLSSIEKLQADSTVGTQGTIFALNQGDLAPNGSIIGNSLAIDKISAVGTLLDLSSTTLTSIESILGANVSGVKFVMTAAQIAANAPIGTAATDQLFVAGTALDLSTIALNSIEVLGTTATAATTFTINAANAFTGIQGTSKVDTLIVKNTAGETIDLSDITFTGIENLQVSTKGGFVDLTIGAGQGGATLALAANNATDTIDFVTGYKVTTIANDAAILAHTLSIGGFKDAGLGRDVLDLSALTNGTVTTVTDITNSVSAAGSLKAALDIATAGNGSVNSAVVSFQFSGNTYVVVDRSAGGTLTAEDAVVKLVGNHTLGTDNFVL
jgi:hypothetical protein